MGGGGVEVWCELLVGLGKVLGKGRLSIST